MPTSAIALSGGLLRHHVGRAAPRLGLQAQAAAAARRRARSRRASRWSAGSRSSGTRRRFACRAPAWRSTSAASARSTRPIARRRSASKPASRHGLVNLGGDVRALGPQATARRGASASAIRARDGAAIAVRRTRRRRARHQRRLRALLRGRRPALLPHPRPAHGHAGRAWQSVSVVAPLCVVAGSCATIAMLMEAGGRSVSAPAGLAPCRRRCRRRAARPAPKEPIAGARPASEVAAAAVSPRKPPLLADRSRGAEHLPHDRLGLRHGCRSVHRVGEGRAVAVGEGQRQRAHRRRDRRSRDRTAPR